MIGDHKPITMRLKNEKRLIGSEQTVSLGLIVTELVINLIKYAFPVSKAGDAIDVDYGASGTDWTLVVSDNGIGGESLRRPRNRNRPSTREAAWRENRHGQQCNRHISVGHTSE